MQTSYPVFESGQVLTSKLLNDLVDYLEQQDRLTRNKLIGIGIVCGLEVGFEPAASQIRLTRGCATTSQGYLLVQEESLLNRFRTYTVPVPKVGEAPQDLVADARYAFFFDANGNQLPLWELLQTDFTPAPGEPAPTPISAAFLQDKVALLFLERTLESLRNCDVSDCSDKGSEIQFTSRRLLIRQDDAKAILDKEQQLATAPVQRSAHPRYDLDELRIQKINPSAYDIDTFFELLQRIQAIAEQAAPKVLQSLKDGYNAYSYLLGDMYPTTTFPSGPFGDAEYLSNVSDQFLKNIFLGEYVYDYLLDVVQSHNEFLAAAARFDAECSPNPDRFPRHILLGKVAQRPVAFGVDFKPAGPAATFNPLQANSGLGPTTRPAPFRHFFIPSPAFDRANERMQEVRSLHYRTYLLALRYKTDGLLAKEIRITPSKTGDYGLSDKAIPFYYTFNAGDDLHRTWSFHKTITNEMQRIYSHQLTDPADHPLEYRMEDHNFYRVEGTVGKGLGQAMTELLRQKRELGLSFGIEPVFIGLRVGTDELTTSLNQQAQTRAQQALLKLLLCRMRDLDVAFLLLMGFIFYYLYSLLLILRRANTRAIAGVASAAPAATATAVGASIGAVAGPVIGAAGTPIGAVAGPLIGAVVRPRVQVVAADSTLQQIRVATYEKGLLSSGLTQDLAPDQSIARLYTDIKRQEGTTRLFEQARAFATQLDPTANPDVVAQRIYPYLSLLDATEELVQTVRAPSLADFDFATFSTRYDGFVQTFDAYRGVMERPGTDLTPEQTTVNAALFKNYSAVLTAGPQAVVTNLISELQKRVQKIAGELLLGAYGKRHPGMEHRGGVPVGGTLVLLYTHKDAILRALGANKDTVGKAVISLRQKLVAGGATGQAVTFDAGFAGAPAASDPLDEFVILADFCLPYLCCDTDCSDVDTTPAVVVKPPVVQPPVVQPPVVQPPVVQPPVVQPPVVQPPVVQPPVVQPPVVQPPVQPPVVQPPLHPPVVQPPVVQPPVQPPVVQPPVHPPVVSPFLPPVLPPHAPAPSALPAAQPQRPRRQRTSTPKPKP